MEWKQHERRKTREGSKTKLIKNLKALNLLLSVAFAEDFLFVVQISHQQNHKVLQSKLVYQGISRNRVLTEIYAKIGYKHRNVSSNVAPIVKKLIQRSLLRDEMKREAKIKSIAIVDKSSAVHRTGFD